MRQLWKFASGNVSISVEGLRLDALLMRASREGIVWREVMRPSHTRLSAGLSFRDYEKLVKLTDGWPVEVKVRRKSGLPWLVRKGISRWVFLMGAAGCLALLLAVNQYILVVRVEGCSQPVAQSVMQSLEEQGLARGVRKAQLDRKAIANRLMIEIRELSFASVDIRGVVATVNVVEAVLPPEIVDKKSPHNLVAGRDAQIYKSIILQGTGVVKPGEYVKKGQLLASAEVPSQGGSVRLVHARGEVLGRIWYEGKANWPMVWENRVRTGNYVEKRTIVFRQYEWTVEDAVVPYQLYESQVDIKPLFMEGDAVQLKVETFYELQADEENQALETAMDKASQLARSDAMKQIPEGVQVEGEASEFYMDAANRLWAVVYLETIENIASEKPYG